MHQEYPQYDLILQELEQLKSENARLKELLQTNGIAYEIVPAGVKVEKVRCHWLSDNSVGTTIVI